MAYDVYTLSGFILEIKDTGEFDKRITFFSKERGIIDAKAISAGKPGSKLRGFLVRFCFVYIDVVHGRTGYRLVRAKSGDQGFLIHKKEAYFILARFCRLISSILPEEVLHEGTFQTFFGLMEYLEKNIVTDDKINSIYYRYALRLFKELGYVDKDKNIENITEMNMQKEYEYILNENGVTYMI